MNALKELIPTLVGTIVYKQWKLAKPLASYTYVCYNSYSYVTWNEKTVLMQARTQGGFGRFGRTSLLKKRSTISLSVKSTFRLTFHILTLVVQVLKLKENFT